MPIKYKASIKNRQGKMEHTYIHTVSTDDLQSTLENNNTQPKLKQKIRNELVRRQSVVPSIFP